MTLFDVTLHICAAVAFAGVCCRLFALRRSPCSGAWQWHLWVLANVLIGLGLLARLFQKPDVAAMLLTTGLALYFGVRWHRRSIER